MSVIADISTSSGSDGSHSVRPPTVQPPPLAAPVSIIWTPVLQGKLDAIIAGVQARPIIISPGLGASVAATGCRGHSVVAINDKVLPATVKMIFPIDCALTNRGWLENDNLVIDFSGDPIVNRVGHQTAGGTAVDGYGAIHGIVITRIRGTAPDGVG